MLAARGQLPVPLAQAHPDLPADRLHCGRQLLASAFGLQPADQLVDIALPGAHRPEGDDVGIAVLGRVGDGDGVLVDVETNVDGATLFPWLTSESSWLMCQAHMAALAIG